MKQLAAAPVPLPLDSGQALAAASLDRPERHRPQAQQPRRCLTVQLPGSEAWRWHLPEILADRDAVAVVYAPARDRQHLSAALSAAFPDDVGRVALVTDTLTVSGQLELVDVCDELVDDVSARWSYLARLRGLAVRPSPAPDGWSAQRSSPITEAEIDAVRAAYVVDQVRRQRGSARVLLADAWVALDAMLTDVANVTVDHEATSETVYDVIVTASATVPLARLALGGVLLVRGDVFTPPRSLEAVSDGALRIYRRALATQILPGPIERVLVLHLEHALTTAKYLVRAIRQLGIEVAVAGPGQGQLGGIEIDHDADVAELVESLSPTWEPDVVLWVDVNSTPAFRPRNIDAVGVPTVAYFIDSHLNLDQHLRQAPAFDHVAVAHGQYVADFRAVGIDAFHLPCAADPDVFLPHPSTPDCDVGFVGNVVGLHARRAELLELLDANVALRVERAAFRDCASAFGRSRVVFNRSLNGDLNMRVFETMAAGRPLVTDRLDPDTGLDRFFEDGRELVLYDDGPDLLDRVHALLEDGARAEEIGRNARAAILAGHTYRHRTLDLFARVARSRRLSTLFLAGRQHLERGEVAEAFGALSQAASGPSPSPNAVNGLGVCAHTIGDVEQARSLFEIALELNPDHRAAADNLAALSA